MGAKAESIPRRLAHSWQSLTPPLRQLMVVTALYTMVIGAALPYEAVYLAERFGASAALIGALSTAAGILNLPVQLGGGHVSDLWGRRPLLIAGTASAGLGCGGLALAPTLAFAVVAFLMLGLGLALLFPISQAMAADLAEPERQERSFAWVYTAVGVGWTVGTVAGGLAGTRSYALLFGVGAALGVVATAAATTMVESSRHETHSAPVDAAGATPSAPGTHVWEDRRFLVFGLLILGVWLLGGQLLVTLPLWVVQRLGYPNALFGLMMALNGVLIAVGQVGLSGSMRRFPPSLVLAAGVLGFGLGYGLMAVPWIPTLLVGTLLLTIGEMLLVPTTSLALDRLAATRRRGQYQGAGATLQSVGFSLGPLVGGLLLEAWGGTGLWLTCLGWGGVCAAGYLAYGRTRALAGSSVSAG